MTTKEKCELLIKKGYYYNSETGLIYSRFGKLRNSKEKSGYIKFGTKINNKHFNLYGHQFAWYFINKECVEEIDHINGIKEDNRICNLRSVTKSENQWNRKTTKGYYYFKKSNKWCAKIKVNYKDIYLGLFNTEKEARNAYLAAKEIYHKF